MLDCLLFGYLWMIGCWSLPVIPLRLTESLCEFLELSWLRQTINRRFIGFLPRHKHRTNDLRIHEHEHVFHTLV
jgi:hypothetical protein